MANTSFEAIISHVKNAIAFNGQDGAHLALDISDDYAVNVAALVTARNKVVKVSIEWGEEAEDGE